MEMSHRVLVLSVLPMKIPAKRALLLHFIPSEEACMSVGDNGRMEVLGSMGTTQSVEVHIEGDTSTSLAYASSFRSNPGLTKLVTRGRFDP